MPDRNNNVKRNSIHLTSSRITAANRWDHFLARVGVNRMGHRVEPGLYQLGNPSPESPVFVTANYTLSFDALRSALIGIDGYILALDTKGVNVWCAAGEGTFGTDELVKRIEATKLKDVVSHRKLILPQLGAPGIAAHLVKQRSGFKVEYGPVRAADLLQYLIDHQATPQMRQVRFTLADRLVLVPVEVTHIVLPVFILIAVVAGVSGWTRASLHFGFAAAVLAVLLSGVILFPILFPWLPTRDFSSKGFILGGLTALPFVLNTLTHDNRAVAWHQAGSGLVFLLTIPPAIAFIALNFTGSTTFTSRSGVRREIFTYIPIMAWMFCIGILLWIVLSLIKLFGGA